MKKYALVSSVNLDGKREDMDKFMIMLSEHIGQRYNINTAMSIHDEQGTVSGAREFHDLIVSGSIELDDEGISTYWNPNPDRVKGWLDAMVLACALSCHLGYSGNIWLEEIVEEES